MACASHCRRTLRAVTAHDAPAACACCVAADPVCVVRCTAAARARQEARTAGRAPRPVATRAARCRAACNACWVLCGRHDPRARDPWWAPRECMKGRHGPRPLGSGRCMGYRQAARATRAAHARAGCELRWRSSPAGAMTRARRATQTHGGADGPAIWRWSLHGSRQMPAVRASTQARLAAAAMTQRALPFYGHGAPPLTA